MSRFESRRFCVAVAVLAALFCCRAEPCYAQTITISELQPLRFGVLQTPGGAAETFTVDPAGATSGSGTLLYGTVNQGIYKLRCTANCSGSWTLSIDVGNVSTGNANLAIGGFAGSYQTFNSFAFPRSGLPKPFATGSNLSIGATATYNSSVPAGSLTPSFDITITVP